MWWKTHILLLALSLWIGAKPLAQSEKEVLQSPFDLINQANLISGKNPTQAFSLAEEALRLSYERKDLRAEAYCYTTLGVLNYRQGRYSQSLNYHRKALHLLKHLGDQDGSYHGLKYLGLVFDAKGQPDSALYYYNTFRLRAEKIKKVDDLIDVQSRIGRIYFNRKQYDQALAYFWQALRGEQSRDHPEGMARAYNAIGKVYMQNKDTLNALLYFRKAAELSERQEVSPEVAQQSYENIAQTYQPKEKARAERKLRAQAQGNISKKQGKGKKDALISNNMALADLYLLENNSAEAIPYLQQSIDLAEELGNLEDETIAEKEEEDHGTKDSLTIRKSEKTITQPEPKQKPPGRDFIHKNDFSDKISEEEDKNSFAKKHSSQKAYSSKEKAALIKSKAYEKLSEVYEKQGAYEEALFSLKAAGLLKDSLQVARESSLASALALSNELNHRDERIQTLEQDRILQSSQLRSQRRLIWLLVLALLGALFAGFLISRSNRARRRANQLLALRSLRSQMNPHFIFNSLNSVNSFISRKEERAANKYLSDFSGLMRTVMEHSSHDFVPLSEELRVLELYLNLEHARFSEKFDYQIKIAPEIDLHQIEIPPMLIQPYIENAIWHGLRYKHSKGRLDVTFEKKGDQLIGIIEDNGIGRARSLSLKTRNQQNHRSTGLKNTAQRLALINDIYHTRLKVAISDLDPEAEDAGTRVEVSIPNRKAQ